MGSKLYALFEGVGIAIDALRANKVRAALTILGIAVGVFVVVLISAAIHGINDSVAKDFASTGPTTLGTRPRRPPLSCATRTPWRSRCARAACFPRRAAR